ncbi:hypothetical protein A4G19_10445 [Pasteurellaceae bacterium Macca]|nr:hypothetical protein [Pasteurellaceae bacterium Macca]
MVLTNRHEWHLFLEATGVGGAGKSVFGEVATILNGRSSTAIISLKSFESATSRSVLVGKTLAYSPDQAPYKGQQMISKRLLGEIKRLSNSFTLMSFQPLCLVFL